MLKDLTAPTDPNEIPSQSTHAQAMAQREPVINDFSIMAATKNGSGSQTANLALLRAFFKMGIPVSGKNLFPSNIQGRPTWYTIRVSKDGYIGPPRHDRDHDRA